MSTLCEGCHVIFTRRGLRGHLQQTRDPLCLDAATTRRQQLAYFESDSDSSDEDDPDAAQDSDMSLVFENHDVGVVDEVAMFQDVDDVHHYPMNDGIQPPEDFELPVADHDDSRSISSDVEAEMQAELEAGWEAERAGAPSNADDGGPPEPEWEDVDPPDASESFATDVNQRRDAEFVLIGDGHGLSPARIVRYTARHPSSRAGQPIGRKDSMDHRYNTAVNGSTNPWAPFQSKLDWEIAQWAKVRSPGSNAFSELLSLGGVIHYISHSLIHVA
jgi:hypothetical protein